MATGQLAATRSRSAFHLPGVPVLLYHKLFNGAEASADCETKYSIPVARFRQQLNQIVRCSKVALLEELWNRPGRSEKSEALLGVTFDDGLRSDYELAFPALQEASLQATFFINTATIGEPDHLSWEQIAEMQRAGMAFHSHSHDHVMLSRLATSQLERQLSDSKRLLEDHLGRPVCFLAAPYGLLNRQVVEVARQVGYRAVCTSWPWPAHPGAAMVSRVVVYRHTTAIELDWLLARDPLCYAARVSRSLFLYLPKQILLRWRPGQLGVRVLEEQA